MSSTDPTSPAPENTPTNQSLIRWSGRTDLGRFRKNNEDAFLALTFDSLTVRYLGKDGEAPMDAGDYIFAVSDGMGGANAGEFASRIAVNKITELLPRTFQMGAQGLQRGGHDLLTEVFARTHAEMRSMGFHYEECAGMGATLSLCWFVPGKAYFAHLGDSRIYYLPRDGGIRQVTHDHSHVGWLVRTGQISETQARFHPQRNVINKGLGARFEDVEPQVGSVITEPGDCFILCTDGVSDGCSAAGLEGKVRKPPPFDIEKPTAVRIIDEANGNSGRDNATTVVVELL